LGHLANLDTDPDEQIDFWGEEDIVGKALRTVLAYERARGAEQAKRLERNSGQRQPATLSSDSIEALKALGYVD
jgi:hypothetical protein